MTLGGKEIILHEPLSPDTYIPDKGTARVLVAWADGKLVVAVPHRSSQYFEVPNLKCNGEVFVPIAPGQTGNKIRFCNDCSQEVVVRGVGGLWIEAFSILRALQLNSRIAK